MGTVADPGVLRGLLEAVRGTMRYQGDLGLAGLDIEPGLLRARTAVATAPAPVGPPPVRVVEQAPTVGGAAPRGPAAATLAAADPSAALRQIREELGDCQRCKLCSGRTQIVFGVGNPSARLMFIGEGPGKDEDLQGEPFVGAAGQLLDKMILAMGLRRRDVYIANVVKCRPPKNRDPEPEEIAACEPFLAKQVAVVQPEVIVALGRHAAQALLADTTAISRLRGAWREYRATPLMPTFHPAYLLRTPSDKRLVWQDLQQVMARLGLVAPVRGGGG